MKTPGADSRLCCDSDGPLIVMKAESTVGLAVGAMISDHLGGIGARKPFRARVESVFCNAHFPAC